MLACAAVAAGACSEAESREIEPLPPLRRPSPEARAGLPEVQGVWRFAGFEIRPQDTTLVRERAYQMTPPGEVRVAMQRMDSIAGQIVRGGAGFPFTGEVRRDGVMALVTFSGGAAQFAAGRIVRDTFWIEITTFPSAQGWSPGARAAMVRGVPGPPFRRLLGGAPIQPPVDSARLRDSLRLDSLRRTGAAVPPGEPAVQPPVAQPPAAEPQRPRVETPERPAADTQPRRPRPQPQRPPPVDTPVDEPEPEPEPEPTPPPPPPPVNAPRDTIRLGTPPPSW